MTPAPRSCPTNSEEGGMSERARRFPRQANEWRFYRGADAVIEGMSAGPAWGAMRRAVRALQAARDDHSRRSAVAAIEATFWCVTRDPHRNKPTEARKAHVVARDRVCVRCGAEDAGHIDHLYPKSLGGANQVWNLALLCARCNLTKGCDLVPWALLLMIDQAEEVEA